MLIQKYIIHSLARGASAITYLLDINRAHSLESFRVRFLFSFSDCVHIPLYTRRCRRHRRRPSRPFCNGTAHTLPVVVDTSISVYTIANAIFVCFFLISYVKIPLCFDTFKKYTNKLTGGTLLKFARRIPHFFLVDSQEAVASCCSLVDALSPHRQLRPAALRCSCTGIFFSFILLICSTADHHHHPHRMFRSACTVWLVAGVLAQSSSHLACTSL